MEKLVIFQNLIIPCCIALILRVFNFANFTNLDSFAKFIQLNFEPLHCHVKGQYTKVFERIPSKQLFAKF